MTLASTTPSRTRRAKSAGERVRVDALQLIRLACFIGYVVALWRT